MKEEIIKLLNSERKELEIPKDKFLKMMKYALEYKKTNPKRIVLDYISLMTDTYFLNEYKKLIEDKKTIDNSRSL